MTATADTLTMQQLDHLRGLLAAATAGPWAQHPADPSDVMGAFRPASDDDDDWEGLDVANCRAPIPGTMYGDQETEEANAALIVAMHTSLPALLATVRRQQAALDAVTELADEMERRMKGLGPLVSGEYFVPRIRTALASPAPTEATT